MIDDEGRVQAITKAVEVLNAAIATAHDAGMNVAIDARDDYSWDVKYQRFTTTTQLSVRRISRTYRGDQEERT
jgi:hypothetical protein